MVDRHVTAASQSEPSVVYGGVDVMWYKIVLYCPGTVARPSERVGEKQRIVKCRPMRVLKQARSASQQKELVITIRKFPQPQTRAIRLKTSDLLPDYRCASKVL